MGGVGRGGLERKVGENASAARVAQATYVVVLDPLVARAFPSDRAVNEALRGLLRSKKESARPTARSARTRARAARTG